MYLKQVYVVAAVMSAVFVVQSDFLLSARKYTEFGIGLLGLINVCCQKLDLPLVLDGIVK